MRKNYISYLIAGVVILIAFFYFNMGNPEIEKQCLKKYGEFDKIFREEKTKRDVNKLDEIKSNITIYLTKTKDCPDNIKDKLEEIQKKCEIAEPPINKKFAEKLNKFNEQFKDVIDGDNKEEII